jgi:hypothetical protein
MNDERNGYGRVSDSQAAQSLQGLARYMSQREDDFFEQAMYVHGHDMREQVDEYLPGEALESMANEGSFDDFLADTERQCDANGEDCESCQ